MTDKEMILSRTSEGFDVFTHYFGEITNKPFRNVFRSDTRPSCRLYWHEQRYVMRDYGSSEWNGDCFKIVSLIHHLDCATQFHEVLRIIDSELNLCVIDNPSSANATHSIPLSKPLGSFVKSNPLQFTAVCKNFTSAELSYWEKYGIKSDTLEKYDVHSIDKCFLRNGKERRYTIYGSSKNPAYGYITDKGKGIKLYRPLSVQRFLYGGELPKPYIFGLRQLPENGETVYITGGEKDVMSLAAHGFYAICFNSETCNVPLYVIKDLLRRFNKVVFLYDSDETGRKESASQVEIYRKTYQFENVFRLVLPLAGTKKEKDISDFFALGHTPDELATMTNINSKYK